MEKMSPSERIELEAKALGLTVPLTTEWHKLHSDVPEYLYHYTDAIGLSGIISSNTIWATNIGYLNDAAEISYAANLIQRSLEEIKSKCNSKIAKKFLSRSRDAFNPFESAISTYVVCFCKDKDLPSQWNTYGSEGGGYAIGLETKYLSRREPPIPLLRKVIYDKAEQKTLIESRVTKLCELLTDLCKNQEERDAVHMIPILCEHLRFLFTEMLCCFKRPSFAKEREWRLVNIVFKDFEEQGTQLQFRISGDTFIPYLELDLSPPEGLFSGLLPIARIVHGPKLPPKSTKRTLQFLLRKHGYIFAEVVRSQCSTSHLPETTRALGNI